MSELVFVYGTLKRGLSNHRFMKGQRFLGEARTAPSYRLVDCGGFPGMVGVENDGASIRGEVWEVDEACRAQLDVLEDVEMGLYALEPVELLAPFDSDGVKTYVYRWPVDGKADAGDEWREQPG
jgi:gamma-glutamylaminecyclotransferase